MFDNKNILNNSFNMLPLLVNHKNLLNIFNHIQYMIDKKILIIDDEPNLIELVEGILDSKNYTFASANNGSEALKKIESNIFKLILVDMMMPDFSGIQVIEKIRKNPNHKSTPIFLLTVLTSAEIEKKDMARLNITKLISKPFDNNDLLDAVDFFLENN